MADLSVVDRGRGAAVLLVHGEPGLAADWDAVADELVVDHRVLAPDRPGYGATGGEACSLAENADLLAELLARRGGLPATVVGHSYGGGLALLLAARHPEAVRGLVLVASVGTTRSVDWLDHVFATALVGDVVSAGALTAVASLGPALRRGLELLPRVPASWRAWWRAMLPDRDDPWVATGSRPSVWRAFAAEERALVDGIGDLAATLAALDVPVDVVAGAWDVVLPLSASVDLADRIPAARLVVVPAVGHFLPRDAPQLLASSVRAVEARAPGVRRARGASP